MVFDREYTYSAAFVLMMISIVLPGLVSLHDLKHEAFMTLDDMVSQGSVPASFRKSELVALQELQDLFIPPPFSLTPGTIHASTQDTFSTFQNGDLQQRCPPNNHASINFEAFEGLSPEQMLTVAQLLPLDNDLTGGEGNWLDLWVWQ